MKHGRFSLFKSLFLSGCVSGFGLQPSSQNHSGKLSPACNITQYENITTPMSPETSYMRRHSQMHGDIG